MIGILIILLPVATALSGYDCRNKGDNVAYTRGSQHDCRAFTQDHYHEDTWEGSIIQTPLKALKQHKTCSLLLKTYTMYCTYSGNPTHLELPDDDNSQLPYKLTLTDCKRAWDYGEFTYQNTKIQVKSPGVTKILIGADIGADGFCMTPKSTSKVVKGQIELIWSEVVEWINLNGNPSSRTLDGSTLSWIEARSGATTPDGVIVISHSPPTSSCNWELLFQGRGSLLSLENKKRYVVVQDLSSGFELMENIKICGLHVMRTDDPNIYIANNTGIDLPLVTNKFQGRWSSLITSGITGLGLISQMLSTRSNQVILENQCLLEYMVRESIIQHALVYPGQAALSLIGEPGWTMIVAGSEILLKRCKEVPIQVAPQTICYSDIPVTQVNKTTLMFMHPTTRILSSSSFEIGCQDDAVPVFNIRSKPYRLIPSLAPTSIVPNLPSKLSKLDLQLHQPGIGLYSHEILDHMETTHDHTSRKEEVSRQLLKIGDGSFHNIQDSSGVLGNLAGRVLETAPGHWLMILLLIISIINILLILSLWWIIIKSKLWLVVTGEERIAAYQAQLLSPRAS